MKYRSLHSGAPSKGSPTTVQTLHPLLSGGLCEEGESREKYEATFFHELVRQVGCRIEALAIVRQIRLNNALNRSYGDMQRLLPEALRLQGLSDPI
jgi:hypothetical protein